MQDITLIKNSGHDVNAKRGARFQLDLPLATPELDHDALRLNLLLPAQRKSRTKVTPLLLCSQLSVFSEFLWFSFRDSYRALSLPPPTTLPLLPFSLQDCMWHKFPYPWSGLRASTNGRFAPIPSFTLEEPPHLPSWQVIHSRVRE
jgi:hypothetical protein